MGSFKDLTGCWFGNLFIDGINHRNKNGSIYWFCKCKCGNTVKVPTYSLTHGYTKSCGCMKSKWIKEKNKKINDYNISGDFGIGYSSNGIEFYFDLDDYERIKDYCWRYKDGYIKTSKPKNITLSRFIMEVGKNDNVIVDHINRNTKDNRKSNLRICTSQENSFNSSTPINNKSGIIGVRIRKDTNKWYADIRIDGKLIYLGSYLDKDDAIISRLRAELKYFGEDFAPQRHLFKKYNIKKEEEL